MNRVVFLEVRSNPWHALDHLGRPAGACPREREANTPGHLGYVGAEVVASEPEKLPLGSAATPDQDTCWHFSEAVQRVVDTPHARLCIRNGELLPADEKTAKAAGIKEFVPVEKALADSKDAAFGKWRAAFGEEPEEVNPFERPKPNDKDAPADVAERSGAARAPDAHKAGEALAAKMKAEADAAAAKADATTSVPAAKRLRAGTALRAPQSNDPSQPGGQ